MLTEDRVWRNDGDDLRESPTAQDNTFDRQASTLVVGKTDAFLAVGVLEDLILRPTVFDYLVLSPIHPAGEDVQEKLPGLQDG